MATEKNGDVQFFNRLYRANKDADGTQYIVHADQVEGLQEAIPEIEAITEEEILALFN